jgi:hypothetical protein
MKWSNKEIQYLKDNWGTLSVLKIANNLGRTYYSVYAKGDEMGLKVHHRFTPNEIKFLKTFYPTRSTKKIAADLKRSVSAIRTKASELGLSKTKEYRSKTAKIPNAGHFKKNQSSWNKGLKLGSDWGGVHTRFKAGQEPHNKLPAEIKEVNGLIRKIKRYAQKQN